MFINRDAKFLESSFGDKQMKAGKESEYKQVLNFDAIAQEANNHEEEAENHVLNDNSDGEDDIRFCK